MGQRCGGECLESAVCGGRKVHDAATILGCLGRLALSGLTLLSQGPR